MAFAADIRQFRTASDLAAYLATLAPADWPGANPIGSTYHNTYSPTEAQWQGRASMDSLVRYYTDKGWTSGPHFFLALHSPNVANNGIWIMTPPTQPGTHAGPCNSTRFGIEVVGDFNSKPPSAAQQQLLVDTLTALHRWAKLGANLNAHRDCMEGRTCPGNAFYSLKADLTARLAAQLASAAGAGIYVARHSQAIFEAPRADAKVALNDTAVLYEGNEVDIDEVAHEGWAHFRSGLGFVPVGILTRIR